ncbi:alpha/beta hydrolase family protein [Undibacterium sp. TJN25]|uniref:alpha/beta hydrolase family protein n=1 Tax=Undibacterium sp. TJN25 TaxID=3413056 RepID=UPI003BF0F8E7
MKPDFLRSVSPCKAIGFAVSLTLFLGLAGCGGGGDGPANVSPPLGSTDPANPDGPGHFGTAVFLKTVSLSDIKAALPAAAGIVPLYAVDAYKVTYTTTDSAGRSVLASGLTAIPRKAAGASSPLLSYQHATAKTDAEAPSNHATPDEPAVLFASMGYLVSATDYVGYGASRGVPHPFLLAAPIAASVTDFMTASARWRKTAAIADNGQLFFTGYSEGAYATIATLRSLTQNKTSSTVLPVLTYVGSGPYDVQLTLNVMLARVRAQNPVLGALINPGFLKNLGANDRANVRNLLLLAVLGTQSDITFDPTFLDNFLNDDAVATASVSSDYDWTPQSPIIFFAGKADTTVPYGNTDSIFQTMSNRGAAGFIQRTDCTATPAEHLPCVPSFLANDIAKMGALAKGL